MDQLFDYQEFGARELSASKTLYLGDDPGLGKTAQVVTGLDYAGAQRVLIVCPASLKMNWAKEFDKWSVTDRPVYIPKVNEKIPKTGSCVAIINYDLIIRPEMFNRIHELGFDVMDFDESHALKNPGSKRTRAVLGEKGIVSRADSIWLNSGTPAPNHPGDMYSLMARLYPQAVGGMDFDTFLNYYCYVIEGDYGPRVIGNKPTIGQLKDHLQPWLLRRKRQDVLPDLPELLINTMTIHNEDALSAVKRAEADMEIAALLGDIDATDEMLEWAVDAPTSTMRKLYGTAKAHVLADVVKDELDGGKEQIILMCWHHDTMNILHDALRDYGVARIDGKVNSELRQQEVDKFMNHGDTTSCRVFIGQMQSAGEGITLTCANEMIIVEPSWVPKDNVQAMLRILRIGQEHKCMVRFAALGGSLDEIIMAVAARKARIVAEIL